MVGEIGTKTFEGGTCSEGAFGAADYLDAVAFQDGDEKVCEFIGGFGPQILPVEPLGLVQVEAGAGLDDSVQREHRYKLVNCVQLPFTTGVPAKECKEVHKGLREVAVLAVAAGNFAGFRVLPLQGENGEAKAVTVTLGKLALSVRLQEE